MVDYARTVAVDLRIDWDFDGTYTDESAYFVSATGNMRIAPPEQSIVSGGGIVDRCQVVLDNSTGRFSPLNTGGALYSVLAGGLAYHAPMYIRVDINGGGYSRIFDGILKIPRETGATSKATNTVTLDCRSQEERFLSKRILTTLVNFTTRADAGQTEAEWMADILDDAGLSASDYSLDDGLFVIPWVWNDNDSPIETCWKLAAACGGRFYTDHGTGKYIYENMAHWLTGTEHTTSQATLDENDFERIEPYYEDKELFQSVTLTSRPRKIATSGTIWQADRIYQIPVGTTGSTYVTIWAELDNPAYDIDDATYDAVSAGGQDLSGNVSLIQTNYAQRIKLQFQNSHTTKAAEIHNLAITGQEIENTDEVVLTAESTETFWTSYTRGYRNRVISGNEWMQTQAQLETLTPFLRDRHELPRLFWKVTNTPGIALRRMGDRLTVQDDSIFGGASTREMWVVGIDFRLDNTGYRQSYLGVDTSGYFEFESSPGYFIIGTDVLGGTKVVFY